MGDAFGQAVARWRKELESNNGVLDFKFAPGPAGPPLERSEAKAGNVKPVDLTITWESVDAAKAVFSNNSMFEYLCGYVVGAPSIVNEGEPQRMETPA